MHWMTMMMLSQEVGYYSILNNRGNANRSQIMVCLFLPSAAIINTAWAYINPQKVGYQIEGGPIESPPLSSSPFPFLSLVVGTLIGVAVAPY